MTDTIKIDNLIENMQELEVKEPEEPVVKEKRRYRSKFFYILRRTKNK